MKHDLAISFEHLVSASLCSTWDGHKEIYGLLVGPHVAHYALFEALSSGLFYGAAGVVEVDRKKAIDHLIQAAEGGHKDAQFELYMHYHQLGEPQKANGWLHKAAIPTDWFSWYYSGRIVLKEECPWVEIDSNLLLSTMDDTHSRRRFHLKKAFRELEAHAKAGDRHAQLGLSNFYQGEAFLPRAYRDRISPEPLLLDKSCVDDEKALYWLRIAAFAGFPSAALQLRSIYENGKLGVDVDLKQAFKWDLLAASNGSEYEQYRVAGIYLGWLNADWGVEVNHEKGLLWLKRAARNGHKDALCMIGRCYHYSLFVGAKSTVHLTCANEEDPGFFGEDDEYKKRAEGGEVSLWIPDEKTIVFQNPDMALRCYVKAARAGSWEAMEELAYIHESGGLLYFWNSEVSIKDQAAALMWKEKAKTAKDMCAGEVTPNDNPVDKSPPAFESDSESGSDLSFLEVSESDSESDSEGPGSEEDETQEEFDSD